MSALTKAQRDARNAYYREWRAKNKDKVAAANERYWINRFARQAMQQNSNGARTGKEVTSDEQ